MEGARKKELRQGYRQRETTGGVYLIRNTINNKVLIESAQDLQGALHRFAFGKQTGSCLHLKLQKDWTEQEPVSLTWKYSKNTKRAIHKHKKSFKTISSYCWNCGGTGT